MDRNQLQSQVALMRSSLIEQGYLDEQQFLQLEELQDDANPNFVEEIVTLFYKDSARLFHNIEQALKSRPIDFAKLDIYMHQFRGSTSRCIRAFQKVKQEHETLRMQLETYFKLRRQAGLAQII
ncbi:hypothetical protein TIFTF001_009247 [Ficus carica]|uniref:Histidine-containing phosphotransfer protein n=1 Tax=Ficus carica TaxID=3494 RepID=A0AA88D3G0_FICCA|nr:hypothetical protein TIFTF001_009247 [Ficus carica]